MLIARLALAAAVIASAAIANAREQIPAEERLFGYNAARVPGCDDPAVLGRLMTRFNSTQRSYWSSDLEIVSFSHVRPSHFRENGLDLIPRRYCRGQVLLNNRRTSPLYFVITQDAGMAGHDFGLQFCVMAYDRQWAYAPECKTARP
jgi:hypothetical protein